MTPFLSIIIAHRNEQEHLLKTLSSIRENSPRDAIEIVVVDDASTADFNPARVNPRLLETRVFTTAEASAPPTPRTRIFKLGTRAGHAAARHEGAKHALGQWLLLTDAHMEFPPGWFEVFSEAARQCGPDTLFCGTYVAGSPDTPDANLFSGARFFFWEPSSDGKVDLIGITPLPHNDDWRKEFSGWYSTEIPAVIGACYFIRRDWFLALGGLAGLYGWSIDEWLLSVRTWLAGGQVRLIPGLRLKHICHPTGRGANGYGKEMSKAELLYNKLAMAFLVLPDTEWDLFSKNIPVDPGVTEMREASRIFASRKAELEMIRHATFPKFVNDIDWLCAKFDLNHPADLGAVFPRSAAVALV